VEWSKMYGQDQIPGWADISNYVGSTLWEELNDWLKATFGVSPKQTYSKCSAQPGWNVKYQKGGKSLCTLYPMSGYFIALVVIGNKEMTETELLAPDLSEYTRNRFESTQFSCGGKWLMLHVKDAGVLEDVKKLIGIRARLK
jgi:hypothetical protein